MRHAFFCVVVAVAALIGFSETLRFEDGKGLFNRRLVEPHERMVYMRQIEVHPKEGRRMLLHFLSDYF